MKKLIKSANLTDIHWGCKQNSELHNQDCMRYIDWFCDMVKKDPEIDHINFLGDWFENRNAVNILTLTYAHNGAKKLNELGLPIFFLIGNHDLYHRHTRDIYSPVMFSQFSNFNIITEPTVIKEIGNDGAFLCPYVFHHEYSELKKYTNIETWWGHFEFKGFIITGYNIEMMSGPEHTNFKGPKQIFCGHFHKRQIKDNVVYIGNTFPTSFSDANDIDRGMMVYNHSTNERIFHNWEDCPKYLTMKLSELLDNKVKLEKGAYVRCVADIPITYEESIVINQKYTDLYELRDFTTPESDDIKNAITDTEIDNAELLEGKELASVDEIVQLMLKEIETDHLNNDKLIEIYNKLTPEQ